MGILNRHKLELFVIKTKYLPTEEVNWGYVHPEIKKGNTSDFEDLELKIEYIEDSDKHFSKKPHLRSVQQAYLGFFSKKRSKVKINSFIAAFVRI